MFNKLSLIVISSLSVLAAASPAATPAGSQCLTGSAQCCNSTSTASNPATARLLGLLGVVVQGVDVLVGLGCTPITVVGLGQGANCAQQPVCCQSTADNGVVGINCTPIST